LKRELLLTGDFKYQREGIVMISRIAAIAFVVVLAFPVLAGFRSEPKSSRVGTALVSFW